MAAADTSGLTLVDMKRSIRLLIVLIKLVSASHNELKRQGERERDRIAWSEITIGL